MSVIDSNFRGQIWFSPSGTMYAKGGMTRKYLTENSYIVLPIADSLISYSFGGDDNNLFVVGYSGLKSVVWHYNGSDWYKYTNLQFNDIIFNDIMVFDKNIFIVGNTSSFPQKTVVLHGRP